MTRKSHRHPPLPTTYEPLYSDLRSASLPSLRRHNHLSNYSLLHTWRHPLPSHPNPTHTLSPTSRDMHRLDDLHLTNQPIRSRLALPKHTWKMHDPIKELRISNKTLKALPEGRAKRRFLRDVRVESRIRRCRDGYCCFRVWGQEAWALKEGLKREAEEEAREFRAGEEEVEGGGGGRERGIVWPRGDWGGLVDRARVSRRLRKAGGEERDGMDGEEKGGVDGGEEEIGDGEWDLVECLGYLSDGESWDEDFVSVLSTGYCSA